jgi:hypothetical protein
VIEKDTRTKVVIEPRKRKKDIHMKTANVWSRRSMGM